MVYRWRHHLLFFMQLKGTKKKILSKYKFYRWSKSVEKLIRIIYLIIYCKQLILQLLLYAWWNSYSTRYENACLPEYAVEIREQK